jgi:hypothetical protein
LHHEAKTCSSPAAKEKVSVATNERKVMSKMTFLKRVALTAIAALGFGALSVIPAKSAVVGASVSIDAATDAVTIGESATAVVTHSYYAENAADSVNIRVVLTSGTAGNAGSIRLGVSDSSTSVEGALPLYQTIATAQSLGARNNIAISSPTGGESITLSTKNRGTADSNLGSNRQPDSFSVAPNGASRSVRTKIAVTNYAPLKAGTYTWTIFTTETNSSGVMTNSVSTTWTVTVTARSTKADASSTSWLRQGTAAASTYAGDSQALASATASSTTPRFTIHTDLNNALGVDDADIAADSLTVVATGEAFVCTSSSASCQDRSQTKSVVDGAADATYIYSTGTAGTATVTITALNAGLSWTKTLTFYGTVATAEIGTAKYKIARTGGFSTAGMFTVLLKDSGGRAVPGGATTVAIESSDTTQIASGSCNDLVGLASDGVYSCELTSSSLSTSGGKATVTAVYTNPVTLAEVTTTYNVTLGGGVSTVVLSTDKATYEPGEKMVVTATAKDASGNPVYDGLSGPTLTANKSLGGTMSMNVYVGGVSTSQTRSATTGLVTSADTIYAPAASGKFRISGLAGDAASTPISVEATVSDDAATAAASAATDAALEAIDAANAATDAANLAAEAADAATVAAEEARDAADAATAAVEALATEVATLMAALKAQITTLANTVAKIAKKVKA